MSERLIDLPRKTRKRRLKNIENCCRHYKHQFPLVALEFEVKRYSNIADVECLILECARLEYVHCIVYLSFLIQKVHCLEVNTLQLYYRLNLQFMDKIISPLTSRKLWLYAVHLLMCTGIQDSKFRLQWFLNLSSEEDKQEVLRVVGEETEGNRLLFEWFIYAEINGYFQSFKVFLYSKDMHVREFVTRYLDEGLKFVAENTFKWRLAETREENSQRRQSKDTNFNKCLYFVCQAGVFQSCMSSTSQTWPLEMAVRYNQPDLVRLLYEAGPAVNNSELFRLSQDPELNSRCQADREEELSTLRPKHRFPTLDDVDAALKIRDFLSQPSPLLDLCSREVVKNFGWGHERDRKVEQLNIPEKVKDKLTWKDNNLWLKD